MENLEPPECEHPRVTHHAPIIRPLRRWIGRSLIIIIVMACIVGYAALLVHNTDRAGRQGFDEVMALRALWTELAARAERSDSFPDSIVDLTDSIPELRPFTTGASRRYGAWETVGTTRLCLNPQPWRSQNGDVVVAWSMVPALYSGGSPRAMMQFADARDHTLFSDEPLQLFASRKYYHSLGIPMPPEMVAELRAAISRK